MQHHFDIVYKVATTFQSKPQDCDDENFISVYQDIEEMFFLKTSTSGGYDGWSRNDKIEKTIAISPRHYGNIALIGNPKAENISTLIGHGAEMLDSRFVFKDVIDAGIHMAFIASRADIKPHLISKATNGNITQAGYIKLQKIFYEDYPEKFI